jgi:S-methylmethionine-dependent homocysteine/selenocysteine methylase
VIFDGDFASDMVSAFTLTNIDEAIGIVRAAERQKIPCAISFTVETNGRLPRGETLQQAIETVDHETNGAAKYFMINCAHPSHFEQALDSRAGWTKRIYAITANASTRSHARTRRVRDAGRRRSARSRPSISELKDGVSRDADYWRLLRNRSSSRCSHRGRVLPVDVEA